MFADFTHLQHHENRQQVDSVLRLNDLPHSAFFLAFLASWRFGCFEGESNSGMKNDGTGTVVGIAVGVVAAWIELPLPDGCAFVVGGHRAGNFAHRS